MDAKHLEVQLLVEVRQISIGGDGEQLVCEVHEDAVGSSGVIGERRAQLGGHEVRATGGLEQRVERGEVRRPDGSIAARAPHPNGARSQTAPDGTLTSTEMTADPRWGVNAPYASKTTVTIPGLPGGPRTVTTTSAVTAPRPVNQPDGWTTETTTTTRNGKTWTSVWNKTSRTRTTTSPVGRVTAENTDDRGRTLSSVVAGLEATNLQYDPTTGRLVGSVWGARTQTMTHGTDGYLATLTDALSRTTSFQNDALGRVTKETRPDSQDTLFAYDGTSLMTQLTPPEKPTHGMSYDSVGLLETYTPPTLSLVPNVATTYPYDAASVAAPRRRCLTAGWSTRRRSTRACRARAAFASS